MVDIELLIQDLGLPERAAVEGAFKAAATILAGAVCVGAECLAAVPAVAFPLLMARMTSSLLISPPLDVPEVLVREDKKEKRRKRG